MGRETYNRKTASSKISDEHERNHFRFRAHSLVVDVRSTCRLRNIKFKDLYTSMCNALQVVEPQLTNDFLSAA